MKNLASAVFLSLISHPVLSATQEATTTEPPAIEALSAGYLVFLGVVTAVILIVCWKYYMRWDEEDDKADRK